MNILIKGFGSIGERHFNVLTQLYPHANIDLISSKNLPHAFPSLQDVCIDKYDYFILATPTSEHYKELKHLDENLKGKLIFVEKPLFSKSENFIPSSLNQIYVGYVLRFHPLLQYIKEFLKSYHVYFVEVSCGSYLPDWRPNVDYRQIYSAKSKLGGGVLLDLSHEIDYLQWIFGDFKSFKGIDTKISELEIDTDDLATFLITTSKGTIINLTLNYFSKIPKRTVLVHTQDFSLELDLINNTLHQVDRFQTITTKTVPIERNDLFRNMHINLLESEVKILPTIEEGIKIMDVISRMKHV